jgi:cephalosporin-C deacetylase-like acetyl esterase
MSAVLVLISNEPARAQDDQPFETVEDLWRDFDPEALPLEVEIIESWEEGDIAFQSLRFTGEYVEETPVRVYAIQGAPREGANLAGVLHVHGGGQTASLDWVRFWAQRGYVCVTFDFCGDWENRTDYTDWGPLVHGNMAEAAGGFQLHPSVQASSWYHWTLVSRRALTLLARHPQVDPDRLGVFGISVGGTLTWIIAALDSRVKAAAPIYGCGYNYDRRNAAWDLLVENDDYNLFQKFLAPEAYAPYVTCPLLFFNATNDGHGLMDRSFEALAATEGPTWQVYSANTDHHIEPREGRALPMWMDWQLREGPAFPSSPELRITIDDAGVPMAHVDCGDAGVKQVDVYYALEDERPQVRHWRQAESHIADGTHTTALPVMDAWDDLRAFANVVYENDLCLSTTMAHVIPAQLGKARATLEWQSDWDNGAVGWKFLGAYTDPNLDWTHLAFGVDETAGPFVGFNLDRLGDPVPVQLYTHILGDPQYQGRPGDVLSFMARGNYSEEGLTLTVIEQDRGLHAHNYVTMVSAEELGPDWKEVTLPLERFQDAEGRSPSAWKVLDKIELRGRASRENPPRFARWRWLAPQ